MDDPEAREEFLLRIAEHVADGAAPPWDEIQAKAQDQAMVLGLQAVARVAAAHRTAWPPPTPPDVLDEATRPAMSGPAQQHPTRWRHLRIIQFLGSGSFGDVYKARDENLDRIVALKLLDHGELDSEVASDRLAEARLLARIDHPNVARVYGAESHEGQVGIWMEFVSGSTLEEHLQRHGTFGESEVQGIGIDLCQALAAVHRAGVLHRDIKAGNVMRESGTGRIVLTDFGTSDLANPPGPDGESGAFGTPFYMAPELFQGAPATTRSDIYSLGVLLFHLASGSYPVAGQSQREIEHAHVEGQRLLLSDLCPHLHAPFVRAVEKAIAPRPENRYRTAGELKHALETARFRVPHRATAAAIATGIVLVGLAAWHLNPWFSTYQVEASLIRTRGATEERLWPGSTIAPGDRLLLEFEASKRLHLYVISYDDRGEQYLLFPMGQSDLKNPLPRGQLLRIPGTRDGKPIAWEVTSSGGREHVVVIASPRRLAKFEREIERIQQPGFVPITNEQLGNLRGIGGIAEAPTTNHPAPTELFKSVAELAANAESPRGTWVRQIDLNYAH